MDQAALQPVGVQFGVLGCGGRGGKQEIGLSPVVSRVMWTPPLLLTSGASRRFGQGWGGRPLRQPDRGLGLLAAHFG